MIIHLDVLNRVEGLRGKELFFSFFYVIQNPVSPLICLHFGFFCSGFLTIGLSSVRRKKGSYLLETIKSIFDQSSYEELKELSVVVHLADFNSSWREVMLQDITQKFAHHIIAGRLMVIHAPEEYYPILSGLKEITMIQKIESDSVPSKM